MKHYGIVLYTLLGLLLAFGFFQAGIWYGVLRHEGHWDTDQNQIISPDQFNIILSISQAESSSFELIDSITRKQYLIYADPVQHQISFLEKSFSDRHYNTSWNCYSDGKLKDAVLGGVFITYRGLDIYAAIEGTTNRAITGQKLDSLIVEVNQKTLAAIKLLK